MTCSLLAVTVFAVIGFIAHLNILNRASTLKEILVRYSLKLIANNILKGVVIIAVKC
jgi:hypothetical protein